MINTRMVLKPEDRTTVFLVLRDMRELWTKDPLSDDIVLMSGSYPYYRAIKPKPS